MDEYLYMIFKSMTHVLSAERAGRKAGVSCRMVPIPRHVSTDCGMCVSVKAEEGDIFIEAALAKGLKPERIERHVGSGPGSRCYGG